MVVKNDVDGLRRVLAGIGRWPGWLKYAQKYTALVTAIRLGRTRHCEVLLASGVDPDLHGRAEHPPIIEAIHGDDVGVAQLLVQHGCDKQARTRSGVTAISLASHAKDLRFARLFED
jgi:hypothetical protein